MARKFILATLFFGKTHEPLLLEFLTGDILRYPLCRRETIEADGSSRYFDLQGRYFIVSAVPLPPNTITRTTSTRHTSRDLRRP